MNFKTFLINLDRADQRLAQMHTQLEALGIDYTRIPAVLGDLLEEPIDGFAERPFQIRTGKQTNKREIGCYFSHLKALGAFLESDAEHALILEDDAILPEDMVPLLDDALKYASQWDLLRLSSSREGEYVNFAKLIGDRRLAVNMSVLKNTAAYVINRSAAKQCLKHLSPMRLPFDVALDRDWTMSFQTACIHPFPVALQDVPGQIPKSPRVRLFRATTFHFFHLLDHVRRRRYRKQCARNNSCQ